jgi:hypothetical protein
MRSNLDVSKDDVARLTRGKPSHSRCGSRQIRHRLRLDERERLAIARSRGYLLVTPSTRAALKNAWHLDCLASLRPCIYVERTASGVHISGLQDGTPILANLSHERFSEIVSSDQWLTLPTIETLSTRSDDYPQ